MMSGKPAQGTAISPRITTQTDRVSGLGALESGKGDNGVLDYGELLPVDEVGEDEAVIDAREDVEPMRTLPTPIMPSKSEVEQHRIDHWPPRSWCDECVEGFGCEKGHFRKSDDEPRSAIISFDYMFLKRTGEYGEIEGDIADGGIKILVVNDSKSRSVFSYVVPQKGIDPKRFAVDMIVESVLWLGYSKIVLKTDNERPIAKLLEQSLAACKVAGIEQATLEHPPPYDSQSNGAVENAVRQVRGRLRTMTLCIEKRLGKRIPPQHPVMTWLVSHASSIIRFRVRGSDGKTPFERIRLRPWRNEFVGFCEKLRYKLRSKEKPVDGGDATRCNFGLFLGFCPNTSQYLLFDNEKEAVVAARTVARLPDERKWDSTSIEKISLTPYKLHA